ncbi:hypothetical protein LguiA_009831 [Lonicera macranthoides]
MEKGERCADLPEECWELIFNRLHHHSHLESPSLVCKRFLSLTNRLRHRLSVVDPTILLHGTVSILIHRFQNLKFIDLSQLHGDLNPIVIEIARSSLSNLETLDISSKVILPTLGLKELGLRKKNLKVLRCANLQILRDSDLLVIGNSLPGLEELDISYPTNNYDPDFRYTNILPTSCEGNVTDCGIEALWTNLRNLRKLAISGNEFITDRSLVALSLNCLFLREIEVFECSLITHKGIQFMLQNSPALSVLQLSEIYIPPASSLCVDSLLLGRDLSTLDFYASTIPDEYLCAIAKARIPLKRFTLSGCSQFTFSGISLLLCTYQSLEYLSLINVPFLTDRLMSDLSQYLHSLAAIKLCSCYRLTSLTFFTLAKCCPLLHHIEMGTTSIGQHDCLMVMEIVNNPEIKSLILERNSYLSDECLKKIVSVSPNLELLDLCSCQGISGGGITEIMKSCVKIKHLRINECGAIKDLGTGVGLNKLEILDAARSGLNDAGLLTIGKRCFGLLKLDLAGCEAVATRGVEEVVRNCERLREINLDGCCNVNALISDWMVFARPSLKKIVPPIYDLTTENQRKLLLRHGCLVSKH